MGLDRIVSNQPQYSLLWRVIEAEVVPLCESEGIGQVVWSPLAQGVLTGKYLPGQPPPAGSGPRGRRDRRVHRWLLRDEVLEPVARLRRAGPAAGYTPAAVALAWVLQNQNVSSAIVGAYAARAGGREREGLDVALDADLLRPSTRCWPRPSCATPASPSAPTPGRRGRRAAQNLERKERRAPVPWARRSSKIRS